MSGDAVRIVLVGATGRTGNAVAHALADGGHPGVELVGCVAPSVASGNPTRVLPALLPAWSDLDAVDVACDVVVDLALPEGLVARLARALARGQHMVVGTTGYDETDIDAIAPAFETAGLGLRMVTNFSLGAILMDRFAAAAAKLLPDAVIIENHHATKLDAPSGTARRTAAVIAAARAASGMTSTPGAAVTGTAERGLAVDGVPVHSLRMAGALAHQDVVFGAPGELLTLRHDALDRSCYAAGVALAARHVAETPGLTFGLDDLT